MCSRRLSRLLQLSVLLLLAIPLPLEPSSHPAGDTGTWDELAQAPEEEDDMAPRRDLMLVLEALPWILSALALFVGGIYCGWVLGKWLWRRWAEETSPSACASARPCCQGHGCSKQVLQLLLENRALMRRCLRQSCRQRPAPRGKRRRQPGPGKKRRLRFPPLL